MSRNPPKINLDSDHDLLVRLLIEFGYKAIDSIESCRSCLGGIGLEFMTPESVARCIGVVASVVPVDELSAEELETIEIDQKVRTTGYYIMWSRGEMKTTRKEVKDADRRRMENVVLAVCEKCPGLSWREVVYEMDHEGFYIYDRAGLQLVLIGLNRGLQKQNTQFPIELLYRHWTNCDAQLAWFTHALKNPDIFCFADFSCDRADIASLKLILDNYHKKDIQVWLCLDLLETLLFLADGGFSQEVMLLMDFPLCHCPDVLLLALVQLNTGSRHVVDSWARQDLVRLCVPRLIHVWDHPNSQSTLHYAWTICPNNKLWTQQLMVDAMTNWYVLGQHDQPRLERVLEVAHDLNALRDLLQCDILPFVIDLACLAARREFLKLDKWMLGKMSEYGAKFVEACLHFLIVRCPTLVTGDPLRDAQTLMRNDQLPAETIHTFVIHLQGSLTHFNLSFESVALITKFITNEPVVLKRPNPPPNVLKQQAPFPPDFPVVPQPSVDFSRPNPAAPSFLGRMPSVFGSGQPPLPARAPPVARQQIPVHRASFSTVTSGNRPPVPAVAVRPKLSTYDARTADLYTKEELLAEIHRGRCINQQLNLANDKVVSRSELKGTVLENDPEAVLALRRVVENRLYATTEDISVKGIMDYLCGGVRQNLGLSSLPDGSDWQDILKMPEYSDLLFSLATEVRKDHSGVAAFITGIYQQLQVAHGTKPRVYGRKGRKGRFVEDCCVFVVPGQSVNAGQIRVLTILFDYFFFDFGAYKSFPLFNLGMGEFERHDWLKDVDTRSFMMDGLCFKKC